MHIAGMVIEGIPPFTDKVEFEFDERVNVFVGPNASGKTTALLGLSQIPSGPPYRSVGWYRDDTGYRLFSVSPDWPIATDEQSDRDYDDDPPVPKWDEAPFAYVGATRLNLPEQSDADGDIDDIQQVDPQIVGQSILNPVVATGNYRVPNAFDAITVRSAIAGRGLEVQLDVMAEVGLPGIREQFATANELGLRCAHSICSETITSGRPRDFVAPGKNFSITRGFRTIPPVTHYGMGVMTADAGAWSDVLYAGNLSAGSQGTLMWIWLLALKMVHHHGYRDGWEKQPAILLIDEIENHLHPTWQRRVIPALLEHFPGLQIFATTHSPFVVAGLKAGQVHLLNRDKNGVVTATTNTEDIVGWTADEILRTMMGVDDPTDEATAAAARELRQLRNEGPRDTEDAEAARQARMQELRRLVDRDLLAGGPMARRREEFEQRFNEALEKYQQSRDLSQDNG